MICAKVQQFQKTFQLYEGIGPPDWANETWRNSRIVYEIVKEFKTVLKMAEFNEPEMAKLRGGTVYI